METRHCAACGKPFQPRSQVPGQSYCSAGLCQNERRRRWQRNKLKSDTDYRDNQARAQRAWLERNPDYWRQYREAHPEYAERNRQLQRARRAHATDPAVAKMDASSPQHPLRAGIYRLRPVAGAGVAKMDAWIVEITLISATKPCAAPSCKERT